MIGVVVSGGENVSWDNTRMQNAKHRPIIYRSRSIALLFCMILLSIFLTIGIVALFSVLGIHSLTK